MRKAVSLFVLPGLLVSASAAAGSAQDRSGDVRGLQITLKSEAPAERAAAARILGEIGPAARDAAPALAQALKDGDPAVRQNAAQALGYIGPGAKVAAPALITALSDKEAPVRRSAAFALGKVGSLEAEAALKTARKDKVEAVRNAAKVALKDLKKFKKS
ncbi:MAG TPA: HEAT repeat domain-containing protein [Vicinamibacteria bacterium]